MVRRRKSKEAEPLRIINITPRAKRNADHKGIRVLNHTESIVERNEELHEEIKFRIVVYAGVRICPCAICG